MWVLKAYPTPTKSETLRWDSVSVLKTVLQMILGHAGIWGPLACHYLQTKFESGFCFCLVKQGLVHLKIPPQVFLEGIFFPEWWLNWCSCCSSHVTSSDFSSTTAAFPWFHWDLLSTEPVSVQACCLPQGWMSHYRTPFLSKRGGAQRRQAGTSFMHDLVSSYYRVLFRKCCSPSYLLNDF
jgi:hypothetical protein